MTISNINTTQPLTATEISASETEMQKMSYEWPYKMAYIPTAIYNKFCPNGYCSGKYLSFLA